MSNRVIVKVWDETRPKEGTKTVAITSDTTAKQMIDTVSRKMGVEAKSLHLNLLEHGISRELAGSEFPFTFLEQGGALWRMLFRAFRIHTFRN